MAGRLNRAITMEMPSVMGIITELPSIISIITVRFLVRTLLQRIVAFIKFRCHTA